MVDANSAYTLRDIDILQQLDRYNLMMIEQPLNYDDIIDHATLQGSIQTPICLDESIHSVEDTRKAIHLNACKIINIKPARVGGLSESLKIAKYSQEHNIPVWCGGMLETGVGRIINIALQANSAFKLPGDTSASNRYFESDIITPPVKLEGKTGSLRVYENYIVQEEKIRELSPVSEKYLLL